MKCAHPSVETRGLLCSWGELDALEEVTGDVLLHFREVVDGVGTFRCPEVKKKNKRIKKMKKKYIGGFNLRRIKLTKSDAGKEKQWENNLI